MRLENLKHEAFCREYIKNKFNQTRAYMAAYPDSSDDAARSSSCDLLAKPNIQARIQELMEELEKNYGIEMQEIVDSIMETRKLAKDIHDLNNSLKADDMLIKIRGGYAIEKKDISLTGLPSVIQFTTLTKNPNDNSQDSTI